MSRAIVEVREAVPTIEGAGVHLHRGFGYGEVPRFDPFLLFDDFTASETEEYIAGFPLHPHRGIETVTYLLSGEVRHKDSLGNEGVIRAGDVQWMTAGSGIVHEEMPQQMEGGIRGFQLWVNLPKKEKMMTPRYQDILAKDIPTHESDGVSIKVIAGVYGDVRGPVQDLMVAPEYFDVTLAPGAVFKHSSSGADTAFVYVLEGTIVVGEISVPSRHIGRLGEGDQVHVAADGGARFLFIAGTPLQEPVAWHGPIVMNTDEELRQVFIELREGSFIRQNAERS